jgi:hypothetical protein
MFVPSAAEKEKARHRSAEPSLSAQWQKHAGSYAAAFFTASRISSTHMMIGMGTAIT